MVFDFHGLVKSGLISLLSGAQMKVGFHKKNCKEKISSIFTNKKAPFMGSGIHVVDMYLSLIQTSLSIKKGSKEFPLPKIQKKKVEDFFQNEPEENNVRSCEFFRCVAPAAGRNVENFAENANVSTHAHDEKTA